MRRLVRSLRRKLIGTFALSLVWAYSIIRGRPVICLTTCHGQFGNRLFLGAHLIAAARQANLEIIYAAFPEYAKLLETSHDDVLWRYPRQPTPWLRLIPGIRHHLLRWLDAAGALIPINRGRGKFLRYDLGDPEAIFDCNSPAFRQAITNARVVFLRGWSYRNYSGLKLHAGEIRSHLRPRKEILSACQQLIGRFREGFDVIVGVHIRQGDYRSAWGGGLFYETERYAQWMRQLAPQFPGRRVAFFIASNEVQRPELFAGLACHQLPGAGVPADETLAYDMTMLSLCDYILAPPSTFSGWASFSNEVPLYFIQGRDDQVDVAKFRVCQLNECHGW
jgi:hypothetical protein